MSSRSTTLPHSRPPSERDALKQSVQDFWNAVPCGTINSDMEVGSPEFFAEVERHRYDEEFHIPEVAEFNDHAGERMLEIGCGLGTDARQFAKGRAQYHALDLSATSLNLARLGFSRHGLQGVFTQGDAERLPFADASLDYVYSHGVLLMLPDLDKAIAEIHRVLKPGGRTNIMLYKKPSLHYNVGIPTVGRLRLVRMRTVLGQREFNELVSLPPDHRGWIPWRTVVNNSTDGVGCPISSFYSKGECRRIFGAFTKVEFETHYVPWRKIPGGRRLPRPLRYALGRAMGTYLYVKATK